MLVASGWDCQGDLSGCHAQAAMHTAGLLQPTKQPHVLDRAWATALQHVVRAGLDMIWF